MRRLVVLAFGALLLLSCVYAQETASEGAVPFFDPRGDQEPARETTETAVDATPETAVEDPTETAIADPPEITEEEVPEIAEEETPEITEEEDPTEGAGEPTGRRARETAAEEEGAAGEGETAAGEEGQTVVEEEAETASEEVEENTAEQGLLEEGVLVESEEQCEEHHGGADVVLILFFMVLIGLVARYCLQSLPVPYTALLLIAGMLLGTMQINLTRRAVVHEPEHMEGEEHEETEEGHQSEGHGHSGGVIVENNESWERFARGIDSWQALEPELMLLVFLPALIFSSAFSLNFHITKRSFGQVLILAGPGVIIGTCVVALFVRGAFPYGWCWPKAFMFGAMISATDPVAVVALLKEVGASARLGTVIEGESLFNDGTAFVFFLLFRDMIPTHTNCLNDKNNCDNDLSPQCATGMFVPTGCLTDRDFGHSIEFFLQLALGGPAIGILFGFMATLWIQYVYNDLVTEITITLVTAYLTFYVAEDVAEVSGVLATVALGLFMGSFAKDRISPHVHEAMHVFWEMMEYVANTVIFVYTGLKVSVELFDSTKTSSEFIGGREWGLAIALYLALQVIRAGTIYSLMPFLSRMGYGMTWKDALVATWGGLRGAVGLALALIVQLDDQHIPPSFRAYTIFYLGFTVIMTLLINGTTMPYLLKALGVTKTSPEKLEVLFHLLNEIEDNGETKHGDGEDDLLGMPDYALIKKLTELDIEKIIPNAKEIKSVIQTAQKMQRPASLGIRHSLTRSSMSRIQSIDLDVQPLGVIEEGELEASQSELVITASDLVLQQAKQPPKPKTWRERLNIYFQRIKALMNGPDGKDTPKKSFETFTPDMLVQDLRSRLLQGVKTAYAEWLEKGYINAKCMFDLIESADTAIDHLDEPISDWKYLEKVAKPSRWRVEVQRLKRYGCQGVAGEIYLRTISRVLFESMLYAVLLARTFIMAHAEAECTLSDHISSELGADGADDPAKLRMLEDAVELVLKESKEATKEAHELMRNFKMVYPEILRAIKTRLFAQEVLLEKQAYVHQIECAGLIETREATLIRDMIDTKLKFLSHNTLMLDLPNSHDLLHSHALFFNLSQTIFDGQVWPHAKPKVFTKGEKIYELGGEPRHVTIVVRGLVKMVDSAGNEAPIGDGFGSVLGVSEIMLNRPRALTMLCETTSEVIQIDRQIFESLVGRFSSIRSRAWQLTGMMLTYLHPWGDFFGASILDLALVFKNSSLLEFEARQELRIRSRAYLVDGSVREAGFAENPRTITGPAPLGPMMGIYNCESEVKILRLPAADVHKHSKSSSFGNTRRMLARSSGSLSRVSIPLRQSQTFQAGAGMSHPMMEITEGSVKSETVGSESGASTPRMLHHLNAQRTLSALSADLETRVSLRKAITGRGSIEF